MTLLVLGFLHHCLLMKIEFTSFLDMDTIIFILWIINERENEEVYGNASIVSNTLL